MYDSLRIKQIIILLQISHVDRQNYDRHVLLVHEKQNYNVLISSDKYHLSLPVGSLIA